MNSGWTKRFSDGTIETGSDNEVKARKASWRKGRLEGLVAVDLCMNNRIVALQAGEGDWWQADDYVAPLVAGTVTGTLTARRTMRKLTEQDIGKWIVVEMTKDKTVISVEDKKR